MLDVDLQKLLIDPLKVFLRPEKILEWGMLIGPEPLSPVELACLAFTLWAKKSLIVPKRSFFIKFRIIFPQYAIAFKTSVRKLNFRQRFTEFNSELRVAQVKIDFFWSHKEYLKLENEAYNIAMLLKYF